MYSRVQQLIPWDLSEGRIQGYKLPKSRRLPLDIPVEYRATIGLLANGGLLIEAEPYAEVAAFPRARFKQPVKVAFFVYGARVREHAGTSSLDPPTGNASTEEAQEQEEAPPIHARSFKHNDEIWFEGVTEHQCPRNIRSSVARMHINMSHMNKKDMIRHLAAAGAKGSVLAAVNALKCAVCMRNKPPKYPHASKAPRVGQFGDRVQIDIFTVTLLSGEACKMLGIIDLSTLYHICAQIGTRNPDEIFDVFDAYWLRPFGLPWCVIADLDGGFQGAFLEKLNELGIPVDFIPPDAHWQLGTIERHNAAWRINGVTEY